MGVVQLGVVQLGVVQLGVVQTGVDRRIYVTLLRGNAMMLSSRSIVSAAVVHLD